MNGESRRGAVELLLLAVTVVGCGVQPTATPPSATATATTELPATPVAPPVVGPEPSDQVGAFYYPWYGNPEVDGAWTHWSQAHHQPPLDLGSDYFPLLGAYSSMDPEVVAQHFAWLREAGVGLVISSWWGQGSREDQAVPLLLELGERYGVRIAFHIEPYRGRTAEGLVEDVRYLYQEYGDSPAFYRSAEPSRWSRDDREKGLFFVWLVDRPDAESEPVEASYWTEAVDSIHDLSDGGLVIANTTNTTWVDGGHFDGLYNYATLRLDRGGFAWAQGLPPDAWYVPSVIPGFSAQRVGYEPTTFVDRRDGATYDEQWAAALETRVRPRMVAVTSFNEWHEGTQIEPAEPGATDDQGSQYREYAPLPPEAYLDRTQGWAQRLMEWSRPSTTRARIRIETTSDWTNLQLVQGGSWLRPELVSASEETTFAWMDGNELALRQDIFRARGGGTVAMVVDILLAGLEPGGTLVLRIGRGHLGQTHLTLWNYSASEPVLVEEYTWAGLSAEGNTLSVEVPAAEFVGPAL